MIATDTSGKRIGKRVNNGRARKDLSSLINAKIGSRTITGVDMERHVDRDGVKHSRQVLVLRCECGAVAKYAPSRLALAGKCRCGR